MVDRLHDLSLSVGKYYKISVALVDIVKYMSNVFLFCVGTGRVVDFDGVTI